MPSKPTIFFDFGLSQGSVATYCRWGIIEWTVITK